MFKACRSRGICFIELAILSFLLLISTALAQIPDQEASAKTEPAEAQKADGQNKEKRGEDRASPRIYQFPLSFCRI